MFRSLETVIALALVTVASTASAGTYLLDLSTTWTTGRGTYGFDPSFPEPTITPGIFSGTGTASATAQSRFNPGTAAPTLTSMEADAAISGSTSGSSGIAFDLSGVAIDPEEIFLADEQYFRSFVRLTYSGFLDLTSEQGGTWAGVTANFSITRDDTGEIVQNVRRAVDTSSTLPGDFFINDTNIIDGLLVECGFNFAGPVSTSHVFEILSDTPNTYTVSLNGDIRGQAGTLDCDGDRRKDLTRIFANGDEVFLFPENGEFEQIATVPLPGTLPLLLAAIGLVGMGLKSSRRL